MSISRRELGLGGLAAVLHACRRAARPGGAAVVEVALDALEGPFERLSGVQGSPSPLVAGEVDLTQGFRLARIASCRIDQDCEPNTLTLGGLFPDERADPDAEASYRFEAIDRHLAAADAAGASVLWQASYDVGQSDRWVGMNLGGRPPEDLQRWTRVVGRCLAHFNRARHVVTHAEFVNEPDGLGGFHGPHASRLAPAFLAFLGAVARHSAANASTPVQAVGPGIPLSWAEWPQWAPRFEALLDAVKRAGHPLPVFSFHTYGRDTSPLGNARLAKALRALLDARGFGGTALWNTEWQAFDFLRAHLDVGAERAKTATEAERRAFACAFAAYAVACKLRWQGAVSGSYYYRANQRAFPPDFTPRLGALGLGRFFHADGQPGPLAFHELLLARAQDATPVRCATRFDDDGRFVAQGLRHAQGRTVSVLLSNLATAPRRVEVQFGRPIRAATLVRLGVDGLRTEAVDLARVEIPPLAVAWLRAELA